MNTVNVVEVSIESYESEKKTQLSTGVKGRLTIDLLIFIKILVE